MSDSSNEQFGQIYDKYIDKIYRFIYLKVDSKEVAEDITSKVFIKGLESYQNQGAAIKNPGAFLYQIAKNSVIDYYREKGRTKIISPEILPEMADINENPQDKAILSSDINVIRKAMQKLENKEHQDIIIWHYLEDIPIADIAEMVGKPAGTVRVELHRGLKDLKDIIKEA